MAEKDFVICSIFVGEHIEEVAGSVCKWLEKCVQSRVSPQHFSKIWNEFIETEELGEVPGTTPEGEYWLDNLGLEEDLDEFYQKALENDVEKFIIFDNNAFIDIVAVRGHPPGRDVALCVLREENVGGWTDEDTQGCLGDEYLKEELKRRKK